MLIRRLTTADIAELQEIDAASFAPDDQYEASFYFEALTCTEFAAIGIVASDTVVAWALINPASTPVRIRSLAVHPQFRRRRYATALIGAIVDRHGPRIDLLVAPQNADAIAFYERMGFRIVEPDPEMTERVRMALDRA